MYKNPEDFAVCPITALFEYMCVNPDIIQNPDGPLFPGANQEDRFRKILKQLFKKHEGNLDEYDIDELGTHSIRKGATTYASSGSTASPSSVAINNRGGWTLGSVRDVYMLYEKAGDHYVGLILAGLPLLSARFPVSEPNFWVKCPWNDSVIQDQLILDGKVLAGLRALFGDVLRRQVALIPFLQVGLACVLHHMENLQILRKDKTSSMHLTGVYTSNEIAALSDQVVVRYPFEEKDFFAIKLTGIPPHVAHLAAIEQMRGDFLRLGPSLLSDFEKMLNDRTYADVISENRMEAIMEKIIGQKLLGLTE